ncbi:MAG TPA: hypothetical protein PKY82_00790 [Pyrinomonadaceae bacterium]|nr:hypothetical protein [Pyrinomonadaceae bacterium]
MNVATPLEKVEIPAEFAGKTAFLFEVKDKSFLHLGIEPSTIALVDNSKEFSTDHPIAFVMKDETYIGLPEKIAEDLYYLENKAVCEPLLIFSIYEIKLIGQIRGIYRQNSRKKGLVFEKI